MEHAYPPELARYVAERWAAQTDVVPDCERSGAVYELPELEKLESLLSTAYQAGLLREEGRAVTFRLILCDSQGLDDTQNPPHGNHVLRFDESRAVTALELRRLAPAADYYRTLIGINFDEQGEARIWGVVHTGTRWLRAAQGGRNAMNCLPPAPVIHASSAGKIEVSRGLQFIARLDKGWLSDAALNVFESKWLASVFAAVRHEVLSLHEAARNTAFEVDRQVWAQLDKDVLRRIAQQMVKRVIATIAASHHGGILLFVPTVRAAELQTDNSFLSFKYQFADGEPRARFRTLILRTLEILARHGGTPSSDISGEIPTVVGWDAYEAMRDDDLNELDESIFEMAHLLAALAATDGAVVLTQAFEVLGFGAEITGELPRVPEVARALDLEAATRETVLTARDGTRHRAVYRFCEAMPEALGIVISQDGGVRFIKHFNGAVTYWNQTTSPLDV